jgi:hypothetical protein
MDIQYLPVSVVCYRLIAYMQTVYFDNEVNDRKSNFDVFQILK